jgi:class 3 adenylate cyclase
MIARSEPAGPVGSAAAGAAKVSSPILPGGFTAHRQVEFVMSSNVQLRWIAEAEARAVRQAALSEHAESQLFAGMERPAAGPGWLDRLTALALRVRRTAMRRIAPVAIGPPAAAGEAGENSDEVDADRVLVTILISDIVESTMWVARMGDHSWRELLDCHDVATRRQIKRFGGREIRNCGDGFLAIFDSATRAVRCAEAIAEAITPLGICVRGGVHTGEIHLNGGEISGIAVHIAARIAAIARPCELVVSATVRNLAAGSRLAFDDRGAHRLRGVPEEMRLYAIPLAGNRGDRIDIVSQAALPGPGVSASRQNRMVPPLSAGVTVSYGAADE